MKNNDYKKMINVDIPDELDICIKDGLKKGKKKVKTRKCVKRLTTGIVTTFAIFVGSINISPAFADSLKDVAIVGTLVKQFQLNAEKVQGGTSLNYTRASINLEKDGEREKLILSFDSKDAALYNATLNHFPETVTISLPGTDKVNILGESESIRNSSSYVKSIYSLNQDEENTTYLQIEFNDTADIYIEEYKDPGKIVINLKQGTFEGRDIYSVRTLSFAKEQDLKNLIKNIDASKYRILRDDKNGYLLEFGQFDKKEDAQKFTKDIGLYTIVETRWSNDVPTGFFSKEEYIDENIMNEYYQLLMKTTDIQDILDYLDNHMSSSSKNVQDNLLKGLTGYIKGEFKDYDLDKLNKYYKMIGKDIYQELRLK